MKFRLVERHYRDQVLVRIFSGDEEITESVFGAKYGEHYGPVLTTTGYEVTADDGEPQPLTP